MNVHNVPCYKEKSSSLTLISSSTLFRMKLYVFIRASSLKRRFTRNKPFKFPAQGYKYSTCVLEGGGGMYIFQVLDQKERDSKGLEELRIEIFYYS